MTEASQRTRAKALSIGVEIAERSAFALLGCLIVLALLGSMTGN